jgi:AcrR family transcriptional regulator
MRNKAKDEAEKAVRMQRALESGFRLFAERGIDLVTMPEIADDSGVTRPSLYRYFSTKPEMVVAIGAWKWKEYLTEARGKLTPEVREELTAKGYLEFYLDSFLDLYQNHSDILRFNHYFNSYVEKEHVTAEQMGPYRDVIEEIVNGFYRVFRSSADGTLRPDVSVETIVSSIMHIMLAAVTRYAVGLAYVMEGSSPEDELVLLRNALLREFSAEETGNERNSK